MFYNYLQMEDKKLIEQLSKYNIKFDNDSDLTFLKRSGYYKYRKLKTKVFNSLPVNFSDLDNLFRFDIHLSRIIYKYLRPIERGLKNKILNQLRELSDDKGKVDKELIKCFHEMIKSRGFKDVVEDKTKKILLFSTEIINASNKPFNKGKTLRRFIDECEFSTMTRFVKIMELTKRIELSNFNSYSKDKNGAVSIDFVRNIRNTVMHYNVAFDNQKLKHLNYWLIIERVLNSISTLISDLFNNNKDEIMKKIKRDINKAVDKIYEGKDNIVIQNLRFLKGDKNE